MSIYLLILLCFAFGTLCQRVGWCPPGLPQKLNLLVVNVAFPAVIFLVVPELQIDTRLLFPMAAPWAGLLLCAGLSLAACRYFGWSRAIEANLLILTALGNTGFLGFPMAKAFFDAGQLPYALIYDQIGTFLGLSLYATVIIALYGSGGVAPRPAELARRILLFPPFISLVIALLLPSADYPPPLSALLGWMGATIVPLTMFSLGLQFRLRIEAEYRLPLLFGLGIKMLLLPVAVWSGGKLVGADPQVLEIAVFLAAMPPMITGAVMLIAHDLAPRLTVSLLGFGTLASLVTLPLCAALVR